MDLKWEYDSKSSIWLQPFSLFLNNLIPVECAYCEWFYWDAKDHKNEFSSMKEVTYATGSRKEGICIPDLHLKSPGDKSFTPNEDYRHWIPDEDTMTTKTFCFETENRDQQPIFEVEFVEEDKRYVRLRLTEEWKQDRPRFKHSLYLHQIFLLPCLNSQIGIRSGALGQEMVQGPVHKSYKEGNKGLPTAETDTTTVFTYPMAWPEVAMEWLVRPRENGWPSPEIVQDIFESSCHIAPVGRGHRSGIRFTLLEYMKNPMLAEKDIEGHPDDMDMMEWRLSFSIAENKLGGALPAVPRQVMILLKMLKKLYFPEGISTYHLKNLLFWEVECRNEDFWSERNIGKCLLHIMDRLHDCLKRHHLPHYFIPESNILSSITAEKSKELAGAVEELRINILDNYLSLVFRLHSHYYFLQDITRRLILDECLVKIKDANICPGAVEKLYIDILTVTLNAVKPTLNSLNTENVQEDDGKLLIQVGQYTFLSVIARLLCELYLVKGVPADSFQQFIEENTKDVPLINDRSDLQCTFKEICLQYFAFVKDKNAPFLNGVHTAIYPVKEIQRIRYQKLNESLPNPFSWVKQGDSDRIVDIVTKQIQEMSIDNLSNEEILKLVGEQFQKLLQRENNKDSGE